MQNNYRYNILKYSLIAFPLSFAGLPIYLHAPDFYTTSLGLNIETIGISLLFLRIIDAIFDPIIGYLSDKLYKYRGLILYLGSFFLLLGFWMIFNPENIENLILWFSFAVFICTFGYSILVINVQALGGLWKVDRIHVTQIMATREGIGLIGLLSASILPTILFIFVEENQYNWLFVILLFFLLITLYIFISWMKSSVISKPKKFIKPSINKLFASKKIKLIFTVYFFNTLAAAFPASLIIFYVRDFLGAEHLLGTFLLFYFISGALSMPIWEKLSTKFSNIISWMISIIFSFVTFIWAFFLGPGDIYGFYAVCLSSGMAVGANLALPSAIIAKYIVDNNFEVYASSYYSLTNFISKSSLALATGTALPFLGFFGYVPGQEMQGYLFPLIYAFFPCLILVLAIIFIVRLNKC